MNDKELIKLKQFYNKYLFDNQIIDYDLYIKMHNYLSKKLGDKL